MGIRVPQDPRLEEHTPTVDSRVGDAYPAVKAVAEFIQEIRYLAHNLHAVQLRDVEFSVDVDAELVLWRYVDDADWSTLITFTDLLGADIRTVVPDLVQIRDTVIAHYEAIVLLRDQSQQAADDADASLTATVAARDIALAAQVVTEQKAAEALASGQAATVSATHAETKADEANTSAQQSEASAVQSSNSAATSIQQASIATDAADAALVSENRAESFAEQTDQHRADTLVLKNAAEAAQGVTQNLRNEVVQLRTDTYAARDVAVTKRDETSDLRDQTQAIRDSLDNVENKSSATIRSEITPQDISSALGYAPLGSAGTITYAQLLATPRKINGVDFDGSKDITVTDGTKLPLAGGALTGNVSITSSNSATPLIVKRAGSASNANMQFGHDGFTAAYFGIDAAGNFRVGTTQDLNGSGQRLYHTGYKPTAADVGLGNLTNAAQIPATEKGAANGVAPLDGDGLIPSVHLPSYVDDVLEFPTLADLPVTGSKGIIYIAADTNFQYRWADTQYIELSKSPGTTDAVPEGVVNYYFTQARVRFTTLPGLSLTDGTPITDTDSIISALGKLQKQNTDAAKTDIAQSFTAAQRITPVDLVDGTTITPDFSLSNNFNLTLTGNRVLANPTNMVAGQSGVIVITQDATGGRTLAFGSAWKFEGGTAPSLTTAASSVDTLAYYVESSGRITAKLIKGAM